MIPFSSILFVLGFLVPGRESNERQCDVCVRAKGILKTISIGSLLFLASEQTSSCAPLRCKVRNGGDVIADNRPFHNFALYLLPACVLPILEHYQVTAIWVPKSVLG